MFSKISTGSVAGRDEAEGWSVAGEVIGSATVRIGRSVATFDARSLPLWEVCVGAPADKSTLWSRNMIVYCSGVK